MKSFIKQSPLFVGVYRSLKGLKRSFRRQLFDANNKGSIPPIFLNGYRNIFCGYYDKSLFRPNNENQIIVHANNANPFSVPKPGYSTDILLIEWQKKKIVSNFGNTYSWNWQQGARAHWLRDDTFIYNIYDTSTARYRAKIGEVENGASELLPIPVQESHPSGLIFSISYEVLSRYRPDYGYRNIRCSDKHVRDNRLTVYNLNNGDLDTIVTVEELVKATQEYLDTFVEKPKLNHVLVSPDGKSVVFLFRYFLGSKRITDMYFADVDRKKWRMLLHDKGVSHYNWIDSTQLLFTGKGGGGFGYHIFNIDTDEREKVIISSDGHPVYIGDGKVISDSYPDRFGRRHLFLLDIASGLVEKHLASFVEPAFIHGETRCDLHPSLSKSKRWVQVDMMKGYRRCVGIIDLWSMK